MRGSRRRILFVVENLTLAQVVRLAALAARLDSVRYEVHFAASEFDPLVFAGSTFRTWKIATIDKESGLKRLERGQRLYELPILRRYVDEELQLFERVRPDLIVGDFRLSLAVSAPLARVPVATLINAYWSPYAVRSEFPVPDHPIVNLVGAKRAARYFPQVAPKVFAHFAAPLNELRAQRGLSPVGDLLQLLSYGSYTLYPDVPELCPTADLPPHHRYLGPVLWSPGTELPRLHGDDERRRPLVYVTLGSSGLVSVLDNVLAALGTLPVTAWLATANRVEPARVPPNVHVASFLPGNLMARNAAFVITNGGSSTGYQALAEGRPVLGISSNMDQYLAMSAIERAGAGVLVRGGEATQANLRSAMVQLLESSTLRASAESLARVFARHDCHAAIATFLDEVFEGGLRARAVS